MVQRINKRQIAFLLPAYNESKVIRGVLKGLVKELKKQDLWQHSQIVVVNDGSSDKTAHEVLKVKDIILINHVINLGAGAATRTALHYARKEAFDFAVTMDSDGQHAPADVIKIARAIIQEDHDVIIGSRLINYTGMPWYRVLGNKGLSLLTFLFFGLFVQDSQSGLRAYNRKGMEHTTFHSNSYAFCSEMLWSAKKARLNITEKPIAAIYTDYSLSKGQTNWGIISIVRTLIKRRVMEIFGE